MTDEHSGQEQVKQEQVEQFFRDVVKSLRLHKAKQVFGGNINALHETIALWLQAAASYLSVYSTERQEKILTQQRNMLKDLKKQSAAMESQTTWLLRFTVALLFAVIVQIILAAVLLLGVEK